MKTLRFFTALAALCAATLSASAAETVTLKGLNGRYATLEVVRMGSAALVAKSTNGNEVAVRWETIDLDHLEKNYPGLNQQRLAAQNPKQIAVDESVFTQPAEQMSLAEIKEMVANEILRLSLDDEIKAAGDRTSRDHTSALRFFRGYGADRSAQLVAALNRAKAITDNLPPSSDVSTFREGVLRPAIKAFEEMSQNPKDTRGTWIDALRGLSLSLSL